MLNIIQSSFFKKNLKKAKKQHKDLTVLRTVVHLLATKKPIPKKYDDHPLVGNWKGYRELHLLSDWLLYKIDKSELYLARIGTHSGLFKK